MIQITDILKEEAIFISLKAAGKRELLNTLIQSLGFDVNRREAVTTAIFEREAIISTGVGNGIALPHCKIPELDKNYCAFAALAEPMPFESFDGVPVNLVLLLASPKDDNGLHLKLLSRISRILSDKNYREKLMALKSCEAVVKVFREEEEKYLIK